jgi:hypothetical protein
VSSILAKLGWPTAPRPRSSACSSAWFPLDRYGHLFPEADTALRVRLDALFLA